LLGQACAHCPIFPTAASRRSLGRVSVPVWLVVLSDQLPIAGLVGRYPANYLIGRRPLPWRLAALTPRSPMGPYAVLAPVSQGCPPPQGTFLRAPHPSAADARRRPRDLHVLSMPPAFALSQDQTLRFIIPAPSRTTRTRSTQFSLSPRSLAHSLEAPLPAAAPPRRARRHDRARTHARTRKPAQNPGAARASSPDHKAQNRKHPNDRLEEPSTTQHSQHSATTPRKTRAIPRTPNATPQHRSRGEPLLLPTKPDATVNEQCPKLGRAAEDNLTATPSQALP
jgi:hypothetical protein